MSARLLGPTVLRMNSRGEWFLMNKQSAGWSSYCYGPYLTLDDVRERFAFTIIGAGEDRFGIFLRVAPATLAASQPASASSPGAS